MNVIKRIIEVTEEEIKEEDATKNFTSDHSSQTGTSHHNTGMVFTVISIVLYLNGSCIRVEAQVYGHSLLVDNTCNNMKPIWLTTTINLFKSSIFLFTSIYFRKWAIIQMV